MSSMLTARDKLISIDEAARVLDSNESRVYAMIRNSKFPSGVVIILGKKRIRFNEEKLRDWQSAQEQFITVNEAARLLEASPKIVRDGVACGIYKPPVAVRVPSGRIFFHRDKLLSWILDGGSYQPTQQEIDRDFEVLKKRTARTRSSPQPGPNPREWEE